MCIRLKSLWHHQSGIWGLSWIHCHRGAEQAGLRAHGASGEEGQAQQVAGPEAKQSQ